MATEAQNSNSNASFLGEADNFDDDLLPDISFNYDYEQDGDADGAGGNDNGDGFDSSSRQEIDLDLQFDQDGNPLPKKASIVSCIINLLNTVAGAGMLGLPGAYAGSGFFMGTVLLIVAAFFSTLGLHLLAVSATTAQARLRNSNGNGNGNGQKPASFYTVATAAMPEFAIFIDGAVALKCFGVATGYFVTVGDCMVDSFHYLFRNFSAATETTAEEIEEMIFTNRQFWVIVALVMVLPISFFRTLEKLKFTSTLSLMLIYSLAVGIVLYAEGFFDPCEDPNSGKHYYPLPDDDGGGGADETCKGELDMVTNFDSTMKNLAIFVFSFTCHQNVFTIVNELQRPTQWRVNTVIIAAIASAFLLYMIVAIEGYRTYGSNVKGDILLNYPQNGLVTMMRIGIAIMVILSYPLQLDPSRRCLTSLVYALVGKREQRRRQRLEQHPDGSEEFVEDEDAMLERLSRTNNISNGNAEVDVSIDPSAVIDGDEDMMEFLENFLFYGITCVFLVFSFIIAMSVSDLGLILGVVGATGSTMVSYILPGAIYLKLHPEKHLLRSLAHVQFSLGILIVPTALYFVVFKGGGG